MKYRVIVAIFCFVMVSCYNYSKSCSDGVCTIVENGQVSPINCICIERSDKKSN